MKPLRDIRPITLAARSAHRIESGKGLSVTCFKGPVWITQHNDPGDVVLEAGQSFVLNRAGLAVVFALADAAILVGAAGDVVPVFAVDRAHNRAA